MYIFRIKQLIPIMLSLVCLFACAYTRASTTVYEISKGEHKLFLVGTIHVLRAQDFPLAPEFDKAYEQAQVIVTETNLARASSPEFGNKMAQAMTLNNGKTLVTLLKPDVLKQLQVYMDEQHLPLASLQHYQPIFISTILTMTEAQKIGTEQGVDFYYNNKAIADHKTLGELETADEVLAYMKAMCSEDPNLIITSSIEELKTFGDYLPALLNEWKRGDLDALNKDLAEPMQQETPTLYKALVVNRNQKWLPKIKKMLNTPEVEMVMVGSLHLSGGDGLLAQLQKSGYSVKPYAFAQ